MLYKRDTVYLYIVHFSSEPGRFGFFTTNDRTDIMSVYTDYTVRYACKWFFSLLQDFPDDRKTFLIVAG